MDGQKRVVTKPEFFVNFRIRTFFSFRNISQFQFNFYNKSQILYVKPQKLNIFLYKSKGLIPCNLYYFSLLQTIESQWKLSILFVFSVHVFFAPI